MAIPAKLSDVLGGSLEGVTRIVVRHERRSAFRLLSLIELVFWIAFMALFLVCLLVLFVFATFAGADDGGGSADGGDGGFELPWKVRFFRYWHELRIQTLDANDVSVSELSHAPRDEAEGHAVLVAVLGAADRAGLVVVETYGGDASETFEVYYGGQPLLAHPDLRSLDEAKATLEGVGYELEFGDGEVKLQRHDPVASKLLAGLRSAFGALLFPFMFWSSGHRASLAKAFADLRGLAPRVHVVTVSASRRLTAYSERGGKASASHTVDARDLLAITYAPCLDYDKDVTRRPPSVRLLERDQAWGLFKGEPRVGRAYRDLLLLLAIEQWAGVPSTATRPTRCPYCGNLYVFAAQPSCPSCGASPGLLG